MHYELIIAETIDDSNELVRMTSLSYSLYFFVWNFPQQKIINILTSK